MVTNDLYAKGVKSLFHPKLSFFICRIDVQIGQGNICVEVVVSTIYRNLNHDNAPKASLMLEDLLVDN
jgi:hypothetical protein